jgi:ubiquinone/menaquinone biosynthesis C-methylase UbiE
MGSRVLDQILNLAVVLGEVRRVLQPSGSLVAVDALPVQAAQLARTTAEARVSPA